MGKLKKLGIGVLVVIVMFFVLVAIASTGYEAKETELKNPTLSINEIKSRALSNLTYDDLLRNNEMYVGNIVHYKGEIIQVYHNYQDTYTLRISVTENTYNWTDPIYAEYAGIRVLEGDIVEFWGMVKGIETYTAVLGNQVNIPKVDILLLEQLN